MRSHMDFGREFLSFYEEKVFSIKSLLDCKFEKMLIFLNLEDIQYLEKYKIE